MIGAYQDIEVGDVCLCAKGIPGRITRIAVKGSRTIYYGRAANGRRWQSVCPRLIIKEKSTYV